MVIELQMEKDFAHEGFELISLFLMSFSCVFDAIAVFLMSFSCVFDAIALCLICVFDAIAVCVFDAVFRVGRVKFMAPNSVFG